MCVCVCVCLFECIWDKHVTLGSVPRTQTWRGTYYSLLPYIVEATALVFVQQHVKGAIVVDHVTRLMGKNGRSIPDGCERTATVTLPTAASMGFISSKLGTNTALDAFSAVFELPLTRFVNRQTYGHERSLYLDILAPPTRSNDNIYTCKL